MAWHHARLHRLAVSKQFAEQMKHYTVRAVDDARKAESKALAALRKACRNADPASRAIDVEAREHLANPCLTIG